MSGTANAGAPGKVVVQAAMSLAGFIAGPGHDMDWVFKFTAPDEFPDIVQATGAMLSGRNSYDVGERDAGKPSGEAYGGAWHGPSFVLTHRPPLRSPGSDVTFLSGDIAAAVATAKQAADPKDLVVLGADIVRQCLRHGLVDEILLMVLPVLLGDGVRLYSGAEAARVHLEQLSVRQSGDIAVMRYRVAR